MLSVGYPVIAIGVLIIYIAGIATGLMYSKSELTVPNVLTTVLALIYIGWSIAGAISLTSSPDIIFSALGAASVTFLSGKEFGEIIKSWKK